MNAYDLTFLLIYMAGLLFLFLSLDLIRLIRKDYDQAWITDFQHSSWRSIIQLSRPKYSLHWYGVTFSLGFIIIAWSEMLS